MSISAEAAYNFLTSPEAQGKALVAIDLDDFRKTNTKDCLLPLTRHRHLCGSVPGRWRKACGAVVVEDADGRRLYLNTRHLHGVCVL